MRSFEVSLHRRECCSSDVLVFVDQNEVPVSAILHPSLPPTNLYFLLIMRIHEVKRGPFHEHSSQLHSIATGVTAWKKVNSGLFKMYEVRRTTPDAVRQLKRRGLGIVIRRRSSESAW